MDYCKPRRPPALDKSPLGLLPTEIIQHIVSFLPHIATASFASTCSLVRRTTGTQYLSALRASRNITIALLELLAVDLPKDPITGLPSRLLCLDCARLIPIDVGCGVATATPLCVQACAVSKEYVQASFYPPLFHTAMAMHRHGRSPDALLARLTPSTTTTYNKSEGFTSQYSWKYDIVRGLLYLRGQAVHIITGSDPEPYSIYSWPCAHDYFCQDIMNTESASVQSEVRGGVRRAYSKILQCPYCRTVVILGARKFRARGLGLFCSWWKDLGDGRAGDPNWGNHLRRIAQPRQWMLVSYNALNIVDGFDKGYQRCYFDFDGEERRADRKELLRLSPYAVGSKK